MPYDMTCPECGECCLRISFYGNGITDVWCNNCGDVTHAYGERMVREAQSIEGHIVTRYLEAGDE